MRVSNDRAPWLLPLCLALAACAVGPDYHRPEVAMPAHYGVNGALQSEAAPQEAWWRAFGDPELDRLIGEALAQNFDLQAAWARVRQARAQRGVTAGADLPQLNASAQESRDGLSLNGEQFANLPKTLMPNPRRTFTDDRVGVSASWEIDLFGYNARSVEAATARLGGSEAAAHATALAVAAEVARDYLDLRSLDERLRIAAQARDAAAGTLRLTRLRQSAGLAGGIEVATAEQSWRAAEAQLPPLESARRVDLDNLALLLGQTPHALDARLAPRAGLPDVSGVIGVGVPSDLLQRRPDVRRAERELAAANAELGVAVAAQYPRFSLSAALGFDSIYRGSLTNAASRYWSAGPAVSLPLFAGGSLRAGVKAGEAARDEALAAYRQTVLQALADTESALMRVDRSTARVRELDGAEQAAATQLALMQRRVRAGEASELEALQSDSNLQQARDAALLAHSERIQALVALYRALGGGWTPEPAARAASQPAHQG
jgi:NodT family efflux transporter outer membrane factor (OMF) lipoprotein